jgi:hypothetical protein
VVPRCKDNSDAKCYCPNKEFTKKVISCIDAWGTSKSEITEALSYFTGICAAWVPQNPGIVTAIPSTITLAPTVTSSASPITGDVISAPKVPCTTITYSTYTVTVPQVSFVTSTLTGSSGITQTVGLVPATPSTARPSYTGRIPVPHGSSSRVATSSIPYTAVKASSTPIWNAAPSVSISWGMMLGFLATLIALVI